MNLLNQDDISSPDTKILPLLGEQGWRDVRQSRKQSLTLVVPHWKKNRPFHWQQAYKSELWQRRRRKSKPKGLSVQDMSALFQVDGGECGRQLVSVSLGGDVAGLGKGMQTCNFRARAKADVSSAIDFMKCAFVLPITLGLKQYR